MSKNILIVEDDSELQNAFTMVLTIKGYEVRSAYNGEDGIEQVKIASPDLIVLDYFMPVMNGVEFLEAFDFTANHRTKILVASNISDTEEIKKLTQIGADEVVLKSDLTPASLIGKIEKLLDSNKN